MKLDFTDTIMKKNKGSKPSITNHLGLILIILTACLVPLLIRVVKLDYPMSQFTFYTNDNTFFDFYSYVKSMAIELIGLTTAILLFFKIKNTKHYNFKDPILWITGTSIILILLSFLFSINPYVSNHGFIQRFESVWVVISYLLIFYYTYTMIWSSTQLKTFFKWFWISNIILSLIGIMQFIGLDPLISDWIKPFITSFSLLKSNFTANSVLDNHIISQTLYNYNYVGFYISLSLPVFLSFTLYEVNKRLKIAYAVTSIAITFNLIGSTARSGLVGLAVGLLVWIIFNHKLIFKNFKVTAVLILLAVLSFIGVESQTNGYLSSRVISMFDTSVTIHPIKSVSLSDHTIMVDTQSGLLKIDVSKQSDEYYDMKCFFNDQPIEPNINEDGVATFAESGLETIQIYYALYDETVYHFAVETDGLRWAFNEVDGQFLLRNPYGKYVDLKPIDSIGFEGREYIGSARGYIWSRTLPLILKSPLVGYGTDTFPIIFPQDDYLGKYYNYQTANMLVDKAHNIYLQSAVSSGIPYLLSFLGLVSTFLIRSFKKLRFNQFQFSTVYESALFTAIISYLIAGLFNDSTVHVSPVFWVLFGLSFVVFKPDQSNKNLLPK
ncbi:MAG: O-antigen polymerase [uncultured bacterium]|nr:MAG: O-antigen polymerase [uncultured bacterium]